MSDSTESSTSTASLVPPVPDSTESPAEDVKVVILHRYNLCSWEHDKVRVVEARNQGWKLRTVWVGKHVPYFPSLGYIDWNLHSDVLEWADIAILFGSDISSDVAQTCYHGITAINPKIQCGRWSGGYLNCYGWLETEIWRLIRSKPQVVEEAREVLLRVYLHPGGKLDISEANALLAPLGYKISPNS